MKAVIIALSLCAGTAFAQDTNIGVGGVGAGAASSSSSTSNSNSGAAASSRGNDSTNQNANQQGQQQANQQGQQQGQQANNSNTVAPNQQIQFNTLPADNTHNTVRYEGTTTQRFAPSIVAPVLNPTVPCVAAWTGGGSGIGFGFTLGGSIEDKECTRREFARVLQIIGQADAAMAVLCGGEIVSRAAPAMCKKIMAALESADVPPVVQAATGNAVVQVKPVTVNVPEVGAIEGEIKKTDSGTYRFQGKSWVPISDAEAEAQMKASAADVITQKPLASNVYQPQPVVYQGPPRR